jgi:hypothetical protein
MLAKAFIQVRWVCVCGVLQVFDILENLCAGQSSLVDTREGLPVLAFIQVGWHHVAQCKISPLAHMQAESPMAC